MDGRVALVTGAGKGIGRATALALARRGARVMAATRSADDLESLRAEADVATIAVDLATAAGCAEAVTATRARLGPIEILVNNAGIGSTYSETIFDQPDDGWEQTLAINLEAPFRLTREAARDMRAGGYGRIVMVSSTSGQIGSPRDVAYTTSKHGLVGLMRAVAKDVGEFGITCNAVMPGWIHTPMADRSAARTAASRGLTVEDVWVERDALYPRGSALVPEEVAETIAFLCSAAASGVSGETIAVDASGGI